MRNTFGFYCLFVLSIIFAQFSVEAMDSKIGPKDLPIQDKILNIYQFGDLAVATHKLSSYMTVFRKDYIVFKARDGWVLCGFLRGHKNKVKEIILSPDKNFIVSCDEDDEIRIWRAVNCNNVFVYKDSNGLKLKNLKFGDENELDVLRACYQDYQGEDIVIAWRHGE